MYTSSISLGWRELEVQTQGPGGVVSEAGPDLRRGCLGRLPGGFFPFARISAEYASCSLNSIITAPSFESAPACGQCAGRRPWQI
jgi:hypothetical protein